MKRWHLKPRPREMRRGSRRCAWALSVRLGKKLHAWLCSHAHEDPGAAWGCDEAWRAWKRLKRLR